jgi:hypothetical protein
MLNPDPRAYRVALVADAVVNEGAATFDVLAMLEAAHWGVVVLPPSDFAIGTIASIIEYVVDDLCDYARQGYGVVIVGSSAIDGFGVWEPWLTREFDRRNHEGFARFDVAGGTARSFAEFLGATEPAALH